MAWFKVDDGFFSSRKVLSIRRDERLEAVGLWVTLGAWSSKELTDGFIPDAVLDEFSPHPFAIDALINSGLWLKVDNGIQFHDWKDYQPTRDEVIAKRDALSRKRAEAGKTGANSRWQNNGKRMAKQILPLANDDFAIHESKSDVKDSLAEDGKMANVWQIDGKRIAPTPPDPTQIEPKGSITSKAQKLPISWKPTTAHEDYARENSIDIVFASQQFRDHAEATGRSMKNWDAAFRLWLSNSVKWNTKAVTKVSGPTADDWMNS